MNSARDAAVEIIKWPSSERKFRFEGLVMQARVSKSAWDTVREIYRLAATGEWQPDSDELHMLVFAPLENPALAVHIESEMDRILSYRPGQSRFLPVWRLIQCYAGIMVVQHFEMAGYLN